MNHALFALLLVLNAAAAVAAPGRLRVVTYNIHFGSGVDAPALPRVRIPLPFMDDPTFGPVSLPMARGPGQLDRVADGLAALEPDIVLVQEIHTRCAKSLWIDQVARLAKRTGWHHAFSASAQSGWGGSLIHGGNAIFSRHLLSEVAVETLTEHRFGQQGRNFVRARVAVPGLPSGLVAGVTHLSTSPAGGLRRQEVLGIARSVAGVREPMIVGGDFNELPGGADVAALLAEMDRQGRPLTDAFGARGEGDGGTFPARSSARRRIDYLFSAPGLTVRSARVVTELAESDHLPLLAEYDVETAPAEATVEPVSLLDVRAVAPASLPH